MLQIAVHVLREERRKRSHNTNHGEEHAQKRFQGMTAILLSSITLEKDATFNK